MSTWLLEDQPNVYKGERGVYVVCTQSQSLCSKFVNEGERWSTKFMEVPHNAFKVNFRWVESLVADKF